MNIGFVIKGICVSEKSLNASEKLNKHILVINKEATKIDVKNALKFFYNVDRCDVNITKSRKKFRVRTKHGKQVKKLDSKRAIVTMKDGQSLDLSSVSNNISNK